jgi:hypothetical protein
VGKALAEHEGGRETLALFNDCFVALLSENGERVFSVRADAWSALDRSVCAHKRKWRKVPREPDTRAGLYANNSNRNVAWNVFSCGCVMV